MSTPNPFDEHPDRWLSIYPKRIESTDRFAVVMELGGVEGMPEATALETITIFDQLFPPLVEGMRNMIEGL